MDKFPPLNLPPVKLRARRVGDCDYVWDGLRGTWIVLTPEEWVRRHVAGWLENGMEISASNIIAEFPVRLGGTLQRADLVVTGAEQRPVMLVECKAPEVKLDSQVFSQAVRYNSVVHAPYIMLTNGLLHYFYVTWDGTGYSRCRELPSLESLF